jgi:hypothetical protein
MEVASSLKVAKDKASIGGVCVCAAAGRPSHACPVSMSSHWR